MRAAVLVPIVTTAKGQNLLFEVRSNNVSQPGEVCFPGGQMEEGEDAPTAALREVKEELGIDSSAISLIKELSPEATRRGGIIHPILATVEEPALDNIVLSDGEVQEFFLVPLDWFRENGARTFSSGEDLPIILANYLKPYFKANPDYQVKTYYWEYEGHGIWGITARILARALASLEEVCHG